MNHLSSALVLCDLDHLLLGADGNLTQVVRDVLQLFVRRGGRFTAAQRVFMRQCVGHGYAVWDGEVFRLTPAGMVVQNAILEELM